MRRCLPLAAQAAAKELRSAQRRASEYRTHVRGNAPVTAAAAAAAAQALRADDCRQGAAPSVSPWVSHCAEASADEK